MKMNIRGYGYQGLTIDELVSRLSSDGVDTIVDVRLNPISRKKGLSKTALRSALERARIDYLHLRSLGNPKDNRAGFWTAGPDHEAAVFRFREMLRGPAAGEDLAVLRGIAQSRAVGLLCYEADECFCHRKVIIEALQGGSPIEPSGSRLPAH